MQNIGQTTQYATVATATTAEESLRIAMYGAAYVAVPANLVGCKDLSGAEMEPTVYAEVIELDTEGDESPVELAEGEEIVAMIETVIEDTTGELVTAVMITEQHGETYVTYKREDGTYGFEYFDLLNDESQAEVLAAWDAVTVAGLRKLITA